MKAPLCIRVYLVASNMLVYPEADPLCAVLRSDDPCRRPSLIYTSLQREERERDLNEGSFPFLLLLEAKLVCFCPPSMRVAKGEMVGGAEYFRVTSRNLHQIFSQCGTRECGSFVITEFLQQKQSTV